MKRFFAVLFALVMTVAALPMSAAAEGTVYHYEVDGKSYTVIFEDETLSAEERDAIAYCLLGVEDEQTTRSTILCHFKGHTYGDYVQTTVIEHKVYSAVPRCEKKVYNVRTCEICGEQEQTLITTQSIFCCAAD